MKKYLLTCCLLLCAALAQIAAAQDFAFSQFYEMPLLRNPALAGVFDGDVRVSGVFRNQWQSVTVPFQTSAASVEMKFPTRQKDDWITGALQVTYDVAGDIQMKRAQLLPVINYHKFIGGAYDSYLSVAFMGGRVNSQFDPTKLRLDEQFVDGSFNPNNPIEQVFSRTGMAYWDLSTGITYNSGFGANGRYYIGAGLFHVNQPKIGFYTANDGVVLNRKWAFNAGLSAPTSDNNNIVLFADYFKQGSYNQMLGGVLYGVDIETHYDDDYKLAVYLGGMYRWNDAFIPVMKLDVYKLGIGLSYDMNVSKLKTASQFRGGFELTLNYKTKLTNRSADADKVRCTGLRF
jgi:type IX secretion system PorP/SprF family membrane protein